MHRRIGIVVAVVAGVGLLVMWLLHGGGPPRSSAGQEAAHRTAGSAAPVAPRSAPDPRALPHGSISGAIRDEAGAPVAHARVCASARSWQLPDALTRAPACSDSDEQGRYRIGDLPVADYAVHAAAPHFEPAQFPPAPGTSVPEFPLAAGEARTGVDLVLRHGGLELTGVVLDISGGPIARAQVRPMMPWSRPGVATDCDDEGRFSIWVARREAFVTATADGYASGGQQARAPGHVEIRLTPAASLAGTVVDAATDQPVGGARVTVFNAREGGYYDSAGSDNSDADGKFRIEALEPGRFLANAISERGYGRSNGSTLVGLGQHVEGVVVRLFPAHRVAGQIVAAGARAPCRNGFVVLRDLAHERTATLRREPAGELATDGVVPGTYDVTVRCEHHRARAHYDQVTVADTDVTGRTWEVDAGARIHGTLRTHAGAPVEGAQLWTQGGRDGGGSAFDTSRPDGSYELAGLAAGSLQIVVISERGVPPRGGYTVELTDGANIERDLVLDDGGSIIGTVVDPTGAPVPDLAVTAHALSRERNFGNTRAKTGSDGSFTIDALPPGDYRLVAMRGEEILRWGASADRELDARATVRASQSSTVRLVVEGGRGEITGVVIDDTGQPVPDAFLASSRESDGARGPNIASTRFAWWGDSRPILTAPDGSFRLTGLAPGKYTVRAYRKGGGEAVAEHVAIGATARLQIKSTGSIEGTVQRDGAPPRDLKLSLLDRRTGYERSETFYQSEGRFRVADLPAGHFELVASGDGSRGTATLDLGDGEARSGVAIPLEPLVTLTGRVVDPTNQQPVPGIQMFARAAQGGGGRSFGLGPDLMSTSDAGGRFAIRNAPTGWVTLTGQPAALMTSEHAMIRVTRNVRGVGTVDVGDVPMLKRRVKSGEPTGQLGVRFSMPTEDAPLEQMVQKVSWIDPAGPAARSELRVGDVITSVDGIDVTGGNSQLFYMLIQAAPGTRIALGTQRGVTVTVVLAGP